MISSEEQIYQPDATNSPKPTFLNRLTTFLPGLNLLNRLHRRSVNEMPLPQNHSETQVGSPDLPEILIADETATVISNLYQVAGLKIGSLLVDSNIVLTVAGARGQTEFFINQPNVDDLETIEKLNEQLLPLGMKIFKNGEIDKRPRDGSEYQMVNLQNLKGFERVSKLTKIPGITPFDASTGWDGYEKWHWETFSRLKKMSAAGKLPFPETEVHHVIGGIDKGYPDQAIYDAVEWSGKYNRNSPIKETEIPYVSLYGGTEPNFLFHPDHADDPGIKQTVVQWGEILKNFYASAWHQKIKQDPQFITARKLND
jgi:hypothetical protein